MNFKINDIMKEIIGNYMINYPLLLSVRGYTPWKESYDQLRQHIKKQKHYFATNVRLVKAMVFPVIMYGCESWTIKNAEHQRTDAFELWCWRRLSRVP